jgi:hypothetical protein
MADHPPDSEWFQRELGERWQTAGDGIYTLVDDRPADPLPKPDDRPESELLDDLGPFPGGGSGAGAG